MGSGSERSDGIVDGDRGDGMRVYMELRVWPRCHRWLWCGATNGGVWGRWYYGQPMTTVWRQRNGNN